MKPPSLLLVLCLLGSVPARAFDTALGSQTDARFVDELAKCWAFLGINSVLAEKKGDKASSDTMGRAAIRAETVALMLGDKTAFSQAKDSWIKSLPDSDIYRSADGFAQTNSNCLAALSNPTHRYRYWNNTLRQEKRLPSLAPLEIASQNPVLQQAIQHYQAKAFEQALQLAQPLADSGDHDAQSLVGDIYANASGKLSNLGEAEKWLLKSAESGNIPAQFDLAQLYLFYLKPANETKGQQWMLRAANKGHPAAQSWVGLIALKGSAQIAKDEQQGLTWLLLAQEAGDLTASVMLKKMATQFTPAMLAQAQQQASSWSPQP